MAQLRYFSSADVDTIFNVVDEGFGSMQCFNSFDSKISWGRENDGFCLRIRDNQLGI
jgi:hypothetical protein